MTSVLYITRMRFLSDKAHVYNTLKTCEAMAATGQIKVVLASSDDSMLEVDARTSLFSKHGLKETFRVLSLPSLSNIFRNSRVRIFNWLEVILSNVSLICLLNRRRAETDAVYFRDPFVFLAVWYARRVLGKSVFFEIHAVLSRCYSQSLNERLARMSAGTISISYGLERHYKPMNVHSIVSFCAAAEPERFATVGGDKPALRARLGLPADAAIVGYSGNLWRTGNDDSYGIDDIIRAWPLLDRHFVFMGVGKKGHETEDLESLARELGVADRVLLLPWVSKDRVAEYLLASDILAIPAAGARIGNSPTKMFEYLTSGRPIVAARTEAIEEVLTDGVNSLLVDYADPGSWVRAIQFLMADEALSERLVAHALSDSRKFTWAGRGRAITNFIISRISSIQDE